MNYDEKAREVARAILDSHGVAGDTSFLPARVYDLLIDRIAQALHESTKDAGACGVAEAIRLLERCYDCQHGDNHVAKAKQALSASEPCEHEAERDKLSLQLRREEYDGSAWAERFQRGKEAGLKHNADRITTLQAQLAQAKKQLRECPTCSGSGIMAVTVAVLPPDEREVTEPTECAECHGTGVNSWGQAINEAADLRQRLVKAEPYMNHRAYCLVITRATPEEKICICGLDQWRQAAKEAAKPRE